MEKLISTVIRFLFVIAFILLLVAGIDWVLRLFGYTFSWLAYQPGRLFELSAICAIFVCVLLLRQIRNQLRSK